MRPQIEALGLKHVDYIANFSGELDAYWAAMADADRAAGRDGGDRRQPEADAMDVVRSKSATMCWELMFTRPRFQTPDMIEQHRLLNEVADRLDAGKLKCTLKETLSPISGANLKKAHEQLESGTMIGKLVLTGWCTEIIRSLVRFRGRPGFDVGIEAAQGMPRTRTPRKSILETLQTPTTSVSL